jgi:hypothetical protein
MRRAALAVMTYALWLLSAAISLVLMLWLRIFLLIDLPGDLLQLSPWVLPAIDKFGTFILALLWLAFIIITEPYFRKILKRELSVLDVLKVFAVEVLVLGAVYGGHLLI